MSRLFILPTRLLLCLSALLLASCSSPPQVIPPTATAPTPTRTLWPTATPSGTPTATLPATVTPTPTSTLPPPALLPTADFTINPFATFATQTTPSPAVTLGPSLTPTSIRPPIAANFRGVFADGNISFTISDDGKSVRGLKIVLQKTNRCHNGKRLGSRLAIIAPSAIPIGIYGFPANFGGVQFRGWFETALTARGDFTIAGIILADGSTCNLGPISWVAGIQ